MMGNIKDKASYIRGLAEGMKLDQNTNEGKLLGVIIELLNDMASSVEEVTENHLELSKYVDDVDDTLSKVEDTLDSLLEDDDDDDDDDEDWVFNDDDDDDNEDDDESGGLSDIFVECMCPLCKTVFYAEEDDLGRDIDYICPSCEKRVRPNTDYEDEIPFGHRADED